MKNLIKLAREVSLENKALPFSVYSSFHEQKISNVPIIKPLLIFILSGEKQLGKNHEVSCLSGTFVFLSNTPNINMRNIPDNDEYFAILIEFEHADFDQFKYKQKTNKSYIQGNTSHLLTEVLTQFIELSNLIPSETLSFRKQELLYLLYSNGYPEVASIASPSSLCHQIYAIISEDITADWSAERLSKYLFMSESTLRRKLKLEGGSIKTIRNQIKLGYGLHLIQTTMEDIGQISMRCGYQSQSRFTEQFKKLFSLTPSELRKTRMNLQS